jgi:hypothetical protein
MPMNNALCFGVLAVLSIVVFILFLRSDLYNLTCHEVEQGKHRVCVLNHRKGPRNREAVRIMADLTEKLTQVVRLAHADNPTHPGVQRLVANFDPRRIVESLPHSEHTAYTEDKGKKLAFCLTKERSSGGFVDHNTLLFVALHELAHIMTEERGHTDNFWRHFADILKVAKQHQLLVPVDYAKQPTQYCGMTLYENPLFKGDATQS